MRALTRLGAAVALAVATGASTARADSLNLNPFSTVGSSDSFLVKLPGNAPNLGVGLPGRVSFGTTRYAELIFGLCVRPAPFGDLNGCAGAWSDYYKVPSSRNPAAISKGLGVGNAGAAGTHGLGLEHKGAAELPAPDFDFNDVVFSISDLSTTAPEPATMTLLALGLVGMSGVGLIRRRSRRR